MSVNPIVLNHNLLSTPNGDAEEEDWDFVQDASKNSNPAIGGEADQKETAQVSSDTNNDEKFREEDVIENPNIVILGKKDVAELDRIAQGEIVCIDKVSDSTYGFPRFVSNIVEKDYEEF